MPARLVWLSAAIAIELSLIAVLLSPTPTTQIVRVLIAHAVAGGVMVGLLAWLWRLRETPTSRGELILILAAGMIFRATLFPLAPATSPDVHRYLWEGLVQKAGYSPYVYPPNAPRLDELAEQYPTHAANARHAGVHPHIAAIYPPTMQSLFWLNAVAFDGTLWGWKLILLAFDALLALAVVRLLRWRGLATRWLALVWWSPLLVLETYEAGHLDVVGASLLTFALAALLTSRQGALAGGLLGLAFNVKYLWPALAGAYLLPGAWRRQRFASFALGGAIVALVMWLPYRDGMGAAWRTAKHFSAHWTFNDVIFELLRDALGKTQRPMEFVLATLLLLTMALILRKPRDPWRDTWRLLGCGLLLSPVAYPWYFIWIVPGLAGRPPLWLIAWVYAVPTLHLVHYHHATTGQWDPMPDLWWLVGVAPAALLTIDIAARLLFGDPRARPPAAPRST